MRAAYSLALRGLTFLGMFAAAMFVMGYLYASLPLVKSKMCTPTFVDRILK